MNALIQQVTRLVGYSLLLLLTVALASCNDEADEPKVRLLYGPETKIGEGVVRSWVSVTPDQKPVEIGVSISKKAVPSLPNEMTEYKLEFPAGVDIRPYNHIVLDWNPQGHVPATYEHPHFDMHFYMIADEERKAIPGGPQEHTAEFEAYYMPETYISAVDAIPAMGVHWIDAMTPEMNGEHFTKTYIMGANQSKVIFYEPMITLAYLQGLPANKKEVIDVPRPKRVQADGYHPCAYTIINQSKSKEYLVSLSKLSFIKAE